MCKKENNNFDRPCFVQSVYLCRLPRVVGWGAGVGGQADICWAKVYAFDEWLCTHKTETLQ